MLNRLTQLANMIGNFNILKPFQDNQNPTKASEIAKQYNEEQDLIRNEMGKMDDTSAEYQQLASLLRESEQEEQEAVSALTYENQSEEYKTASSTVDDVIDKLGSFAQDDSDLSSLLDERTGIIKNIVAKENELKNAKDEDEIQKIKDEIEKLYEEKAEKEEDLYDYIKENSKYETVSTNLKSAIDGLKKVRGTKQTKKETDAASGGGGTNPSSSTDTNTGSGKNTQELKFLNIADIKPVNFDITVDYNGASIDLSVDFSKLTDDYPLAQLSAIKDQYASAAINYENNYVSCNEAITTLNGNTQALTEALDGIAKKGTELTDEESKLVKTTGELAKSINETTDNIKEYDKSITDLTSETIDLRNERDSLVYPAPPGQPASSEEGKEAQSAYDAAVAEIDNRKQELSKTITENEAEIDKTRKQKDEAEEKLKKDCEELDKNTKCLLENQKFQEVLSGYKENYVDKKQETTTLASAYIKASDKYETDLTQVYANMKAIDDQIAITLSAADAALRGGSGAIKDEDEQKRFNSVLSALSWAQNYLNTTNGKEEKEDDVAGKKAAIDSFANGMMSVNDNFKNSMTELAEYPAENVAQQIISLYYQIIASEIKS